MELAKARLAPSGLALRRGDSLENSKWVLPQAARMLLGDDLDVGAAMCFPQAACRLPAP